MRVYVEWDQGIFKIQTDDGGEAIYNLEGIGYYFQIHAYNGSRFELSIFFEKITTKNQPRGSKFSLGWYHDGHVPFILAGKDGNYFSTGEKSENWMHNSLELIRNKKLKQICISGSHNSGMSVCNSGTLFGSECNTLTQSRSIKDQLMLGARYFDIRPVIGEGDYYTGHYGQIMDTT